jgi:8-oxo-dGTP diphosphatase
LWFWKKIQILPWQIDMIRVAVGILRQQNRILVAERPSGKPYAGYWEFPGGKIEENELSLDALKRELHEELGITVSDAEHWFDHIHHYPDKTVLLEMWMISSFSGEMHSKENQQLRWVTFEEMQALRLLEGNWPIMERIGELFQSSSL